MTGLEPAAQAEAVTNEERPQQSEWSKLIRRLSEVYLGEGSPQELAIGWRISCAFLGAFTYLSFSLSSGEMSPSLSILEGMNFGVELDIGSILGFSMSVAVLSSPLVLALMIACSIKKGGALRFFLVGFFLYSLVLMVTLV